MAHLFFYQDSKIHIHHTYDQFPSPASFSMHAHEELELFYFISGIGRYIVEGNCYDLQPGDILLMRTAEAHKLEIEPGTPYERIAVHFPATQFVAIDPGHRLLRPFLDHPLGQFNQYRQDPSKRPMLEHLFSQLCRPVGTSVQMHLQLSAYLLPVLYELGEAYDLRASNMPKASQQLPAQLATYINDHLFEDISLDNISQTFFLSKSSVNRVFKQATGSSVWKYVIIKRLLAARAMIQCGQSAGEACARCGFKDYSAFFRAYRAKFGHSPSEDASQ